MLQKYYMLLLEGFPGPAGLVLIYISNVTYYLSKIWKIQSSKTHLAPRILIGKIIDSHCHINFITGFFGSGKLRDLCKIKELVSRYLNQNLWCQIFWVLFSPKLQTIWNWIVCPINLKEVNWSEAAQTSSGLQKLKNNKWHIGSGANWGNCLCSLKEMIFKI